ncbi:MAG TPA: hypothetical protein VGC79_00490 [Polyangiaceae bacterium]
MILGLVRRGTYFGCVFTCAGLLLSACAGRAEKDDARHSSASAGFSAGGAPTANDGGSSPVDPSTNGGALETSGGAAEVMPCDKVICDPIPTTCKHLVQSPGECCPTCTDTGCDACEDLDYAEGTHSATKAGDCCPTCVPDPPDACLEGQKYYAKNRAELLDKYGSSGCKNSADCTLVQEDTACAHACNIPLPTLTAHNLAPNLGVFAAGCSSCEAPPRVECDEQIAACVNGKCVTADVQ